MRASFSKAVWGSVSSSPAPLYDVVRGFGARLVNLPFWGVSLQITLWLCWMGSILRQNWRGIVVHRSKDEMVEGGS